MYTILFEREAMDTADAYSEFILTTLAAIAQEESRSISANIAWSNQKRFPAGNVCNKDIYGYEFRKGEYTVNENGYRYRAVFIIPEEAEIVRMVFRRFYKRRAELHTDRPEAGCPAYPAAEQRMQTAAKAEADCAASWRTKGRR